MPRFEADDIPLEKIPTPAGWRILLSPVKIPETTKGGIVLVDETIRHSEYLRNVGKVVGIGEDAYCHPKFNRGLSVETRTPTPWVKLGDVVHYHAYTGMNMSLVHEGETVTLKACNDDEVITIITDTSILGLD